MCAWSPRLIALVYRSPWCALQSRHNYVARDLWHQAGLKVGWYGTVCHIGTSLVGPKPYCKNLFSERHHIGILPCQYRSQCMYMYTGAVRETVILTQNAQETVCRPGCTQTSCVGAHSDHPDIIAGSGKGTPATSMRLMQGNREKAMEDNSDKVPYRHFFSHFQS